MIIASAGHVEVDLTGRTLTFRQDIGDSVFELTPVQTGWVIDQLASVMEVIVPGSLIGNWLQKAFNSGLDVGRNENAAPAVDLSVCGQPGSGNECSPGCCREEA